MQVSTDHLLSTDALSPESVTSGIHSAWAPVGDAKSQAPGQAPCSGSADDQGILWQVQVWGTLVSSPT